MMRKLFTTILFINCTFTFCFAQEAIYWANGNRFSFRLVGATEDQVQYAAQQDGQITQRTYNRENILMAFNAHGRYLLIKDINTDPAQAKQQLENFYNAPGPEYDLLIKAAPLTVIPCKISYNSDEVINYLTLANAPASINRRELVAIIQRNGQHTFVMPVPEAAPLLAGIAPEVQRFMTNAAPLAKSSGSTFEVPNQVSMNTAAPATNISKQADEFKVAIPAASGTGGRSSLTTEELSVYRKKSLQKVDDFVEFLNVITDKGVPSSQKEKAVAQATKLFLPDAEIEVTSSSRSGRRRYKVIDYLNRLKLLPYSSTKVDWHEVNFIKELTQAADGNYYGIITGQQTFTGYGSDNKNVMYSDVTQKNVKVKLQSFQKAIDGNQEVGWEVLLGSIGVSVH